MFRKTLPFLVAALLSAQAGAVYSSVNAETSALYEKALIAKENNEAKAAIIHLKNALQIDDNYIAAHVLLGNLYLEDGNPALAEKELTKANSMGADKTVTIIPLANAYFAQQKYRKITDDIFPLGYNPKEATELFILQGNAHIELKALDLAARAFDEALKITPHSVNATLGLATIALKEGNYEKATQLANQALSINSNLPEVWYTLGSVNHARGNLQQALENYSNVLDYEPDHLAAHIARIGIYLDLEKHPQALKDIKQVRESHADDPRAAYLHAVLLAKTGDTTASTTALKEASTLIDKIPSEQLYDHEATLMLASVVKYSLGEYEKAYNFLKFYTTQYPHNPSARKLYGSTLLKRNDHQTAIRVLEPGLQQAPNDYTLLLMLGRAYAQANKHHLASEMFVKAMELQPENSEIKFQNALSSLAQGKSEFAISSLTETFDQNTQHKDAGIILNLLHLKAQRFDKALAITEELAKQFPDNLTILNLLASNQIATNQAEAAKTTLKKAISIDQNFVLAQINLAKLLIREKKYDEAEAILQGTLRNNPDDALSMIELGKLAYIKNDKKEALRWLEKAYARNQKSVMAANELVNLHLALGQHDSAIRVAEEIELNNHEDLKVLNALARSYLAANKIKLAQLKLQRMSVLAGYNTPVLAQIARLQLQAGDTEKAIWSLQKAVESDSKNLPVRVLLTETLVNSANLTLANEHAQKLVELHPDEPQGYGLLGDIALQNRQHKNAIKYFQKAQNTQPSTYTALRLSYGYAQSGKLNSAIKTLQSWLKSNPDDPRAMQALGEYFLATGKTSIAQRHLESALELSPNNPDLLNNLALLLADVDKATSLDYAKKANQISPDNPNINDTLGWLLIKNGKPEEGLRYLRSAAIRQASNPEIHYHIAVALQQLGRKSEAINALNTALASNVDFPEIKDARKLLKLLKQ